MIELVLECTSTLQTLIRGYTYIWCSQDSLVKFMYLVIKILCFMDPLTEIFP